MSPTTLNSCPSTSSLAAAKEHPQQIRKLSTSSSATSTTSLSKNTEDQSGVQSIGKRVWKKIAQKAKEHHESVVAANNLYYGAATGCRT